MSAPGASITLIGLKIMEKFVVMELIYVSWKYVEESRLAAMGKLRQEQLGAHVVHPLGFGRCDASKGSTCLLYLCLSLCIDEDST